MASKTDECIQVVVRCRPMNRKENDENRKSIINVDPEARQVAIRNPDASTIAHGENSKMFTFDATYDEKTQQKLFYEESCFSIIESTLEGFNSTIFAYGQTGCGKSFTMQGPSTTDPEMMGVIPNSFAHIFQFVKSSSDIEFLIRCCYLELYNEEIKDLLSNHRNPSQIKCELHEDPQKGVYVKNLTDVVVESPEDLHKMLEKGLSTRTTAATLMNQESSRSHSIFTIIVEMSTKDENTGKDMLRVGKLNLVDLAGSERQKKTGARDATLKEGIKINLSLSALGNVISALSEGGRHIPYRDSKLTRLLQDSLGGNTKTMMVAAISPADYNFEETMSTLRYANRAKNIKNKPKINEDPKDAMIREFKAEIERLRNLLSLQAEGKLNVADLISTGAVPAPQQQQHQQLKQLPQQQQQQSASDSSEQAGSVAAPAAPGKSPVQQQKQQQKQQQQRDVLEHELSIDNTANTAAVAAGKSPRAAQPAAAAKVISPRMEHKDSGFSEDEFEEYVEEEVQRSPPRRKLSIVDQELENRQMALGDTVGSMNIYSPDKDHMAHTTGAGSGFDETTAGAGGNVDDGDMQQHQWIEGVAQEQLVVDDMAQRLQQLEGMLVHLPELGGDGGGSHTVDVNGAVVGANGKVKGRKNVANNADVAVTSAEELKEEEKALEAYRVRRINAKKKKEQQKQREMARIIEEKKAMEEELDELRLTAAEQQVLSEANQDAAAAAAAKKTEDLLMKKVSKLKRKYEKKLQNAKEELEEMRDEFFFQRKQMLDAIAEQEKDTKLYETVCRTVLSDRELKKVLEKSRYDDENDEWIVPFLKRKSLPSDAGGGKQSGLPSISGGGGNGGGGKNARRSFDSETSNSNHGNNSNHSGNNNNGVGSGNSSLGLVPLLTLPGSMVTSAAMVSPVNTTISPRLQQLPAQINGSSNYSNNSNNNNQRRSARSRSRSPVPSGAAGGSSPRSLQQEFNNDNNDSGGGGKQSKKQKSKIPKIPNGENRKSSGSYSESTSLPPHRKLNSGSMDPAALIGGENTTEEDGDGTSAGPLDDWGFAAKPGGGGGGGGGDNGSTGSGSRSGAGPAASDAHDYSDDDDFEESASAGANVSGNNGGYAGGGGGGDANMCPPLKQKKKNKKKKQQQQQAGSDDEKSSAGAGSIALPRI